MGNVLTNWEDLFQATVKAPILDDAVAKFDNISKGDVEAILHSFTEVASCFAINKLELKRILSVLMDQEERSATTLEVERFSDNLWDLWTGEKTENEENRCIAERQSYIDALEIIMALLLISNMDIEEKVNLIFDCMDFDGSEKISLGELKICLKSIEGGLCKARGKPPATERKISVLAQTWFKVMLRIEDEDSETIEQDKHLHVERERFIQFCTLPKYPVRSILEMYAAAEGIKDVDSGIEMEAEGAEGFERALKLHSGGDEFMAIKPWKGAIVPPSRRPNIKQDAPDSRLSLEYVHGYRAQDCRNNVKYLESEPGCFVYHAAAVGIKFDVNTRRQSFHMEHSDDILSLAVGPSEESGQLIATGQIGARPQIEVWDAKTMASICKFCGFHRRGVTQLTFAADGKKLISVGLDDQHSVAVYCTERNAKKMGKLLFSAKGNRSKVLCLFAPRAEEHKEEFVTCGVKHVDFWTISESKGLQKTKGLLHIDRHKGGRTTTLLCGAYLSSDITIFGSLSGDLEMFKGRKHVATFPAHANSNCASLCVGKGNTLISGGKNGELKVWEWNEEELVEKMAFCFAQQEQSQNMHTTCPLNPAVRSVCLSEDTSCMLVGTLGSEIFELALNKEEHQIQLLHGGPLVQAHCQGELWGLGCHPNRQEFCTVGDDQTLRIWSIKGFAQLAIKQLKGAARACCYSPDGTKIAVGLGGGGQRSSSKSQIKKIAGRYRIYDAKTLDLLHEARDAKQAVSEIRFSPNGKVLAVASHDNSIYLYSVFHQFKRRHKFNKHNSYITDLDFSKDSQFLQSTCGAYELLYSDISSGRQITSASSLRDTNWDSWTCTLGWPVQGIWPPYADGTDINAVDRCPDESVIATADDFGKVKLFRYPCVSKKAQYHEYHGHSSHVTNVRWAKAHESTDEEWLISLGGNDRCIFQWKHQKPDEPECAETIQSDDDESIAVAPRDGKTEIDTADLLLSNELNLSSGDQFMAVKPWLGAIVPPSPPSRATVAELNEQLDSELNELAILHNSCFKNNLASHELQEKLPGLRRQMLHVKKMVDDQKQGGVSAAPTSYDLELEWVHGYRAHDCRNNLRYNAEGEIVYHAAALGIVLSKTDVSPEGKPCFNQRFNHIHTDDVVAFAMHPNGRYAATGQMGKIPLIQIWDTTSRSLDAIATMEGFHQRAVTLLAFSSDGSSLVSVGQDDDNSVALYDWQSGTLQASAKNDRNKVLALSFKPDSHSSFLSCGSKHIKFWQLQGRNLTSKKGLIGRKGKIQAFTAVVWYGKQGDALNPAIGTAEGAVYLFRGGKLVAREEAHKGAVYAMSKSEERTIITGGKDGLVVVWTCCMEKQFELDLKLLEPSPLFDVSIRSVDVAGNKLLVGTQGSEIYELEFGPDVKNLHSGPLIVGHCKDELWGLAVHPTEREYCTVGDDGALRIWDVHTRTQLRAVRLGGMARCCGYSPLGDHIAVGMGGSVGRGRQKVDGTFRVYDAASLEVIHEARDSKQWISQCKYSPSGKYLAIGSHDNAIYIYQRDRGYRKTEKFKKHNSYITHFDFSEDNQYLQSNCGAYELLFSDAHSGSHITSASSMKDVTWSTSTCTLGWPVQGIWPPCADGTDINAVDRSKSGTVLVTADDFGKVKLFRYPCTEKHAEHKEYGGHSSHVTNAAWTNYDECLISVGGNDKCIFQWKVELLTHDTAQQAGDIKDEEFAEELEGPPLILEPPGSGDQFMAVKPWIGAIKAPSLDVMSSFGYVEDPRPPKLSLELEWVYGYRCHDARNNLYYSAQGNIVFHTAAVGVVMTKCQGHDSLGEEESQSEFSKVPHGKQRYEQTFYFGHTDDIVCLAVSSDRRFAATGELGRNPTIHVWDSSSTAHLATLRGFHKRGVLCLAFSHDGTRLASVGQDNDHSHAVWKDQGGAWSGAQLQATGKGSSNKVLFIEWIRENEEGFSIVSGGIKHLSFWNLGGRILKSKKGIFGKKGKIQPLLCATSAYIEGHWCVITGTWSGEIYVWKKRTCTKAIKAHDKTINCLKSFGEDEQTSTIITGSKDQHVKIWNTSFQVLHDYDLAEKVSALSPVVRAVDLFEHHETNERFLLVGTQGSEVYEFDLSENSTMEAQHTLVMCGHFKDELWGLTMYPAVDETHDMQLFATAGDDHTVRIWSMQERMMVDIVKVEGMSRALAFSPDGNLLAVGLGGDMGRGTKGRYQHDGEFDIYRIMKFGDGNGENIQIQIQQPRAFNGKAGNRWVSDVKFAPPDGELLAIATHDQNVALFENQQEAFSDDSKETVIFEKSSDVSWHNSAVTHIDFDIHGTTMQSTCMGYELLFSDVFNRPSTQIQSATAVRNHEWASWTCPLGWPVQGIWPECADGSDINAVDRSPSQKYLAVAGDDGKVKIFNYPCTSKGAKFVPGKGHSSHVTNVRFSNDGQRLISTGGNDKSIFQWKLRSKAS